jgi:hypothetical protein
MRVERAAATASTAILTPPYFRRTLASTMPTGFDSAFARIRELVADFRANEKFYLSQEYQEQEARRDFIDKFWLALGWDVNHETQRNPFEQEVKVERREHGFSQRRTLPIRCTPLRYRRRRGSELRNRRNFTCTSQ